MVQIVMMETKITSDGINRYVTPWLSRGSRYEPKKEVHYTGQKYCNEKENLPQAL